MYTLLKIIIFVLILHESCSDNLNPPRRIETVNGETKELEETILKLEPEEDFDNLRSRKRFTLSGVSQANYDEKENSNTLGDTDLKSIFVKYDTDDGNTCLLDTIKHDILWWAFPNGTLKLSNARYTPLRYLDLSYGNISEDLDLLQKTKIGGRYGIQIVEAFSAAYNMLNSAPYKTLKTMKGSLRYLSLQGNQFAAIPSDPEAIEQYLQHTQHKPNNDILKYCEELLASNLLNLYERDCTNLQNHTKENKNTTDTEDFIYEDYLQKLQILHKLFGTSQESIAWAQFPNLPYLLELDISNCSIEYVNKEAFRNVSNLRKLFISNNKIMTLESDTFYYIQGVQYLDLSFTNVWNYNYQFTMPTLEVILNLVYCLKIHQTVFKLLPELIYLDLSHSKITRSSAVAFTHLGSKLKYLSLCYTSFPMMSNGLFKNTSLEGLDLSGNSFISYNIVDDAFDGIGDTLKLLYFENSNLRNMNWSKPLRNLQVLGLGGNNINVLSGYIFQSLTSLMVLDLSSNHIGNWYKSVFWNNSELRVLNLRNNNINMLTSEMLKDFEKLEYLSLGDNNFLCNCILRDVVEVAANNNKLANCSFEVLQHLAKELLFSNGTNWIDVVNKLSQYIQQKLWQNRFVPYLVESYENIKDFKHLNKIRQIRFFTENLQSSVCAPSTTNTLNNTALKFQLLDYDAKRYWCFNETDQLQVDQLNCKGRNWEDVESEIHNTITIITAVVGSILGASILGFIIYLKRWHIHYYYASLRSAALLSRASKESLDKFQHLSQHDPNAIYDIFISYCQNDRKWVLEELLPNVESSGDISICLHERDFQIGVTILDNIITSMDRSRSLMLLISSKFLLSHWCQFEMYLAQHRIFEVSKEHLILVFLEDIPRRKRPKTLQYLMDIKTYIKWPCKGNKQPSMEERKLFWKRLRKSLEFIGIGTKDSKA